MDIFEDGVNEIGLVEISRIFLERSEMGSFLLGHKRRGARSGGLRLGRLEEICLAGWTESNGGEV